MQTSVVLPEHQIEQFSLRHHVQRLSLFGSVMRNDFRPDSDIDVLVEFTPDAKIDLFDIIEMENELTELLGRKVDLRTAEDLSRYFRQQVVDSAQLIYERD